MTAADFTQPAPRRRTVWLLAALLALLMAVATISSNRGFDYFWHLATGRWIVEHGALPLHDPFSVSSDPGRWFNGEWLFAVLLYLDWSVTGHAGIAIHRALLIAAFFSLAYVASSRRADPAVAFAAAVVAWYGGFRFLADRPATIGAMSGALAVFLVTRPFTRRLAILFPLLTILWFNLHPSGLLSPVILCIGAAGAFVERWRDGFRAAMREALPRIATAAACAVALLVNPYGVHGILAPFDLVRFIESGVFTNVEWVHPPMATYPLLYVCSTVAIAAWIVRWRPAEHVTEALLFAFVFLLAMKYSRNQGLFYAVYPLVVPAFLPRIRTPLHKVVVGASIALVGVIAITEPHGLGISRTQFPVDSVRGLAKSGARGSILNDDQFGGYLIWTFYPERRALNDGRNELHKEYLALFGRAREDSSVWAGMLRRYDVGAAVVDYSYPVMAVVDPATQAKKMLPKSIAYFPREEWALIAFDDVAMVFARRSHADPALLAQLEYRVLLPELIEPRFRREAIPAAKRELERARAEGSGTVVIARIEQGILLSERE